MRRIGLSTSSVYPLPTEQAFRLAAAVGFDGVEIMVTHDEITQDPDALLELAERYSVPILSVHAPVLLLTQFVWGRDPRIKLLKSAELARAVAATTVVAHPPFRWQSWYAEHFFEIVREATGRTGVEVAVENMFPWQLAGRSIQGYSPDWNPTRMDACTAATLDFSHAALSGRSGLDLAIELGDRLRHIHLCDGSRSADDGRIFDEHLIPGHGTQPVAEVLAHLSEIDWHGSVIAEINTRKAKTDPDRIAMLTETLEFARTHAGALDSHTLGAPASQRETE